MRELIRAMFCPCPRSALQLPGGLGHVALVHELLGEQQTLLKIEAQSGSRLVLEA